MDKYRADGRRREQTVNLRGGKKVKRGGADTRKKEREREREREREIIQKHKEKRDACQFTNKRTFYCNGKLLSLSHSL